MTEPHLVFSDLQDELQNTLGPSSAMKGDMLQSGPLGCQSVLEAVANWATSGLGGGGAEASELLEWAVATCLAVDGHTR